MNPQEKKHFNDRLSGLLIPVRVIKSHGPYCVLVKVIEDTGPYKEGDETLVLSWNLTN